MEAYVIQERPKSKGKGKGKGVLLPMTVRHTREDCVKNFVDRPHRNDWRKEWRKYYVNGWRCVKVKITMDPLPELKYNPEFDMKRLYEWLMDDNRKPAQTFFTSGLLRNIAKEIEFKLHKQP